MAILGFGLIVLILNHESGRSFGVDNDDFGRMVMLVPLAALLSAGILASRRSLGESMQQMLVWVMIALVLVTGYIYRAEFQSIGNRLTAGLIPGRAVVITDAEGGSEIVLQKSMGGHFETTVSIDGRSVPMMVDTGASSIALSWEDASRIGLDPENLSFSRSIMTANGRAMAAPVRLSNVALGPIVRTNVEAMVTERGRLGQSLLGMSFIATLGSMEMRGDQLRLRD